MHVDGFIYWLTNIANEGEEMCIKVAAYNITNSFHIVELPIHRTGCHWELLNIDERLFFRHDGNDFIGTHDGKIFFSDPIAKFIDDKERCFRKIIYMSGNERVYIKNIYGRSSMIFAIDKMIEYKQSLIVF